MSQEKLPEPGEFTRAFKREQVRPPNSANPTAPEPAGAPEQASSAASEPGEFTRYFTPGLPKKANVPTTPIPREPSGVQRPNTPYRPTISDASSNSFTERFGPSAVPPPSPALKPTQYGVQNPRLGPAPDLSEPASVPPSPFDYRPTAPAVQPSKEQGVSEYDRLFGQGATPPPPKQSTVAQSPQPSPLYRGANDSQLSGAPLREPSHKVPTEFTQVAQGRTAFESSAAATASAPSTSSSSASAMPFRPSIPSLSPASASVNTPMGSANLSGPSLHAPPVPQVPPMQAPAVPQLAAAAPAGALSPQIKLTIFFAILAILAVILVVALAATQKS